MKGFEVRSFDQALPSSDFVILMKEQKIKAEIMLKAKNNCIHASLEEAPKETSIDIDTI